MWSNFCVGSAYEPGSTFKPFTICLLYTSSDVEILDRRIAKTARGANNDKKLAKEVEMMKRLKDFLEEGHLAKNFELLDEEEEEWFKEYNLLTAKPVIYAANVSEDDLDVYKRQVLIPD